MNWIIALFVSICFVDNAFSGRRGNMPLFLAGAPKEIVKDFKELFDEGKTDPEIDAAVEGWISKQSPEIKVTFFNAVQLVCSGIN